MAKKFLAITLISIFICLIAIYLLTKYFPSIAVSQTEITIHKIFKFTKPAMWKVEKSPDSNDVLISFAPEKNETRCLINVFFVKADKDYSLQQWLQTGMSNNLFLGSSVDTVVTGSPAKHGTYLFDNKTFGTAQYERLIIKKGNYFADFTLSYKPDLPKTNSQIARQCRQALSSIINSSNFSKIN